MATTISTDVQLTPLTGKGRSLREWLTTFHLAVVALDPFTNEGAWTLPIADRVLTHFGQADVRVALVLPATADECRMFLGPVVNRLLIFPDPNSEIIKALGIERLPSFVHVAMDGTVEGKSEGWQPKQWQSIADTLAKMTGWSSPVVEREGDPAPF
ncbi:MAG: hypothetical protein Q8K63_04220 [Acidimicrobiales bacterium]|nr:hypothetical protein [Acidimicrobiales bacterium]